MKLTFKLLSFLLVGLLMLSGCSTVQDARGMLNKGDKEGALKAAVPFLEDGDPMIRIEAAKLVADIGLMKGGQHLMPLLKDEEAEVKETGIVSLGELGYDPAGADFTKMTLKAQGSEFGALAKGFRGLSPKGMAPLVKAFEKASMESKDETTYRAMLLEIGPNITGAMSESLAGKSAFENTKKIKVLVALKTPKVALILVDYVGDLEVGEQVTDGLVEMGSLSVTPALARLQKITM